MSMASLVGESPYASGCWSTIFAGFQLRKKMDFFKLHGATKGLMEETLVDMENTRFQRVSFVTGG